MYLLDDLYSKNTKKVLDYQLIELHGRSCSLAPAKVQTNRPVVRVGADLIVFLLTTSSTFVLIFSFLD